ncbi:reverse transcriptase/maturase family protein [Lactiplantibacillus nangangensis]|uniref:Reverse transcriptase/maturase family protein n=1 Tax=Lactiplantibacillus nangangensis TaxID=2559917 RepID=A0ABW1SN12_9LACO|nr:reverse transcriptase/maturase family protein [Lactiplantibacillus nangangensis]
MIGKDRAEDVERLFKASSKVLNKKYRHFDTIPSEQNARNFISDTVLDPKKVKRYRFFPFIVYSQERVRYHRTKGSLRAHAGHKVRPISLVAHHDALIYVKYAEKLNSCYENYLNVNNISKVPTAYRKTLHHSNIEAAKEVFDFVVDTHGCWIIKGDFKGFFDNLRHRILKNNLCKVLSKNQLDPDWRSVFESITRYRWVDSFNLTNALKRVRINRGKTASYINNRSEFPKLISKGKLKVKGPNQIGIPQGTPISAVLANTYMIDFDKELSQIVTYLNGLYRRYSDDFVIVIPKSRLSEDKLNDFIHEVMVLSQQLTSLKIEQHKTKAFNFADNKITLHRLSGVQDSKMVWFDYLGFVFNGATVRMRERGVYKFHYKSKRAINLFLRIESDRERIKNNTVPSAMEKQKLVWISGRHVFQPLSSIPSKSKYERRIVQTRKNISYNLSTAKLATKMYVTGKRYGERYSMVGYAKRAQALLSENDNRYQVEVLDQVRQQIRLNQIRIKEI